LGEQAGDESTLSPGAENTLKEVARKADDYYLVQSAGDTLKSWDIRPPLRVALRKRENQSMALFSILVGLIFINLFAIVTALIGISKYPLKIEEKGKRTIVRSAMFSGWFVMTIGILATLAAGAIGFLGHNSLPSPTATLLWNLPAYLGTVVYVLLTGWIWRQGRQAIPITDQAVPVHR
jgi:membrane protease YdiL (CAAX protease family)